MNGEDVRKRPPARGRNPDSATLSEPHLQPREIGRGIDVGGSFRHRNKRDGIDVSEEEGLGPLVSPEVQKLAQVFGADDRWSSDRSIIAGRYKPMIAVEFGDKRFEAARIDQRLVGQRQHHSVHRIMPFKLAETFLNGRREAGLPAHVDDRHNRFEIRDRVDYSRRSRAGHQNHESGAAFEGGSHRAMNQCLTVQKLQLLRALKALSSSRSENDTGNDMRSRAHRSNFSGESETEKHVLISRELAAAINEQIGHEFGASMQYLSIAGYFQSRQLTLLSNLFIKQSEEEREHAMKFVKYLMETKGGLAIPAIPAPTAIFPTAAAAVEAALKWEEEVTRQITNLMDMAVAQNDYIAQSFLQWFIDEQLEEVVKMDRLLTIIRESGEKNLLMVEAYLVHVDKS